MEYPRVLVIRIMNTGKKAVSAEDFAGGEPIKIAYESNPPFDVQLVAASPGLAAESTGNRWLGPEIGLRTGSRSPWA